MSSSNSPHKGAVMWKASLWHAHINLHHLAYVIVHLITCLILLRQVLVVLKPFGTHRKYISTWCCCKFCKLWNKLVNDYHQLGDVDEEHQNMWSNIPDCKFLLIDVDQNSIWYFRIGSVCYRRRSKVTCYLGCRWSLVTSEQTTIPGIRLCAVSGPETVDVLRVSRWQLRKCHYYMVNGLRYWLTQNMIGRIIPVQHSQYHGCWCPRSWRRQDIGTHNIDCRIGELLPYTRKDFNYLCHVSVEEWYKSFRHF